MAEMNDHDLLVTLHEQMRQVRVQLGNITEKLDDDHVDPKQVMDHETRLRRLEFWGAIAIGFLYAIDFYFQFVQPHVTG